MLIALLLASVSMIFGMIFSKEHFDIFSRFLGSFVIIFLCCCLLSSVALPSHKVIDSTTVHDSELLSLNTEMNNVQGGYFLGCGHEETEDYYIFYLKENNTITRKKVRTSDVLIKITDQKPYLQTAAQTYHNEYDDSSLKKFLFANIKIPFLKDLAREEQTQTIFVPKNSILENYSLK